MDVVYKYDRQNNEFLYADVGVKAETPTSAYKNSYSGPIIAIKIMVSVPL